MARACDQALIERGFKWSAAKTSAPSLAAMGAETVVGDLLDLHGDREHDRVAGKGIRLNVIAPGRMSEIQNLAAFLMAGGIDWMTGQVIMIDGGNSLATGGNFYAYRAHGDVEWAGIRETIRAQDRKDKQRRAVA